MALKDFFRSAPTMSAEKVRSFLDEHDPTEYNLVDVRQAGEYEEAHIPGTKLIPIGELETRLDELDPAKPTVTY